MQKLTIIGEQEEELKCDESDGAGELADNSSTESPEASQKRFRRMAVAAEPGADSDAEDEDEDEDIMIELEGPTSSEEKEKNKSYMNQKRHKSKQIKKILKERLNIDCLRMLCPDENNDDINDLGRRDSDEARRPNILGSQNLNDSYHILMREIGVEQNDELSQAFINKNGMAPREQLNSFTEMFSVRDLLGVGAFGVVLLVKNRFTKEKSALKIIAKENLSERAQKILKNESTIMQTMDHQSVVSLKRIFENQKFIILEMELIPGGQLKRLFKLKDKQGEPRPLSDLIASKVMKSLLKGVAYVHARDIVHRDLKPENVLLKTESDDCFHVKIVDFGLSAEQNWRKDTKERAGTPIYMAPEQVIGKGYSKKIDLWACGIIAYQLLTCGKHPCYEPGDNYYKKLQQIETQPLEFNFPESFTPLAKDFFLNLCSYPPSQRYDAITALQHPWITRNDKDEIPLNQQQEFAMFQTEHQLRKVMRLAYFASLVKMSHSQGDQQNNSDGAQGESSSDIEIATPEEARRVQSPALIYTGSPLKGRGFSRWLNNNQQLVTTSTSAETQFAAKYDHDSFLEQSSLASYKELILREAETQKQSIESTSTDSPKRFRLTDDKKFDSKNSLGTNKNSTKFVIPQHTGLFYSKHSASSNSPTKRNKLSRKHKQNTNSTSQKTQQQLNQQPMPITSPFRVAPECIRDSINQVNFSMHVATTATNTSSQLATMNLISENATKRKAGGAQSTFVQTQHHVDAAHLVPHMHDDRNLMKQQSSVSQRDQGDAIILPITAVTQSKQFSYQHSQTQNGRPGRNLVSVKSPMGPAAIKEWEHVTLNNTASMIEAANQTPGSSTAVISRKSKLLQKQKVTSIEQEGGSSKLAIAGQQTLTNRKQSEFLQGQKVVIKDSLRAAGVSLVMPNNSKTMSSEIGSFEEPIKRDSSSNSLLHMSPRDKVNVTTVMRKGTSKKHKKPSAAKNYEVPEESFHSPQKQVDLSKRPFPHPSELLILQAVTPQGQKHHQPHERHTEGKVARQGSQFKQQQHTMNDIGEYGDCSTLMASPPKKGGTKSCKKRTLKKNKTNEMHFGGNGGSKSLNRQTTFDIQSMNGYLGRDGADQKIDWLKLAKEERTIAGSKLLTQAAEMSALGQPVKSNNHGQQFSYQGHFLLRQGTYQPVQNQFESSKTTHKVPKASRKATKSPIVNLRSVNSDQASVDRQLFKKKSLDGPNALIVGQTGFASLSNSISNIVQIGQSPDQYYRQSQKHRGVTKSKTLGKKQLKESELASPTLHNGILGTSSDQIRHMWPSQGDFTMNMNYDQKNVPIKGFGATTNLNSAQKRNKQTSRAAVLSILNGTPDLRVNKGKSMCIESDKNDSALTSQGGIRSDLDDIQQRLRPRELKFEQISKFNHQNETVARGPVAESGPRRQNTTSGIVQQQEVGLWLFGKQQSYEHMSSK